MRRIHTLLTAIVAVSLLGLTISPAFALISSGFEQGLGHNAHAIGTSIAGLDFTTTSGGDVWFADINSTWYSVTSDNGAVYDDGDYFLSGYVAAYVPNAADVAKVQLSYGPATYFTVGYSSEYWFVMEAYDISNNLLTTATGAANSKAQGGTGLSLLTVSHPDIAYVLLHDHGGFWMIDNIQTDAPVPEPTAVVVLCTGLVGLFVRRRR